VVCEGLGEGAVADEAPGFDVAAPVIRCEVGGRDEDLLVIVDDCLGVKDVP